jgi:hypothetical protein
MSVIIDTIGPTTLSRVTATTVANPNTTQYGITTGQVKNILTYLFRLDSNVTNNITSITWSNILTNLLSSPLFPFLFQAREIRIGGASTTVKVLGNTLNVNDTFPTILTGVDSIDNIGRIQAGYVTVPAGTTLIRPPTITGAGRIMLTGTQIGTVGINGNTTSGFNIVSSVAQEVNWVFLY